MTATSVAVITPAPVPAAPAEAPIALTKLSLAPENVRRVDAAFLARLSKAGIAAAVAQGLGSEAGELPVSLLKLPKGEAVSRAAQALEGRGCLPEPLHTPGPHCRRDHPRSRTRPHAR